MLFLSPSNTVLIKRNKNVTNYLHLMGFQGRVLFIFFVFLNCLLPGAHHRVFFFSSSARGSVISFLIRINTSHFSYCVTCVGQTAVAPA